MMMIYNDDNHNNSILIIIITILTKQTSENSKHIRRGVLGVAYFCKLISKLMKSKAQTTNSILIIREKGRNIQPPPLLCENRSWKQKSQPLMIPAEKKMGKVFHENKTVANFIIPHENLFTLSLQLFISFIFSRDFVYAD